MSVRYRHCPALPSHIRHSFAFRARLYSRDGSENLRWFVLFMHDRCGGEIELIKVALANIGSMSAFANEDRLSDTICDHTGNEGHTLLRLYSKKIPLPDWANDYWGDDAVSAKESADGATV